MQLHSYRQDTREKRGIPKLHIKKFLVQYILARLTALAVAIAFMTCYSAVSVAEYTFESDMCLPIECPNHMWTAPG